MSHFEKLYTVDDIARMTLLTTRTIRTYLKDGLLTGRRIGGQWRFTDNDIQKLFDNSTAIKEINENRRQDVIDFIDGVNTDISGEIQTCAIVDYYCNEKETARKLTDYFIRIISAMDTLNNRFYYEYIEGQQKARYTFLGIPSFILAAMQVVENEWKNVYRTQGLFDKKALNYKLYRPSYPDGAIQLIVSLAGGRKPVIADIGSGTGKLTGLLLKSGMTVFAVEPNPDMRSIAEADFSRYPEYHSICGTGENTGLESDSIDIITVAEAYHWFDNEQSKVEMKRILKDGGYVVLLWNQFGDNPFDSDTADLNKRLCNGYKDKTIRIPREERAISLFGKGRYRQKQYDNTIMQTFDSFLGGSISASCAPNPGDANYGEYEAGLRTIFDKYSENGLLKTIITTIVFYGQI